MENTDEPLDESPTDELPVLTEIDVVELDASAIMPAPQDDELVLPAGTDEDLTAGTGRFPLPDDLPDVEPFPESDEELAFLRRKVLLLEATLDDKEAENASLAERLRATREAVERRDETERLLRIELAEAVEAREQLEARLAEADALAAQYADRVADLTSRLRTLEQSVEQRDAVFAELEAELIAREARVVERERALAESAEASADTLDPASPVSEHEPRGALHAEAPDAPEGAGADGAALEAALAGSREEAAALAAYIDCRRAHWLALEAQLEEHRERLRELEQELEQRAERERRETERADAEARRAEALRTELAQLRTRSGAPADAASGWMGSEPSATPEPASTAAEPASSAPALSPTTRPLAPGAKPEETPTKTLRVQRPPDGAAAPEPLDVAPAALLCLTSDPPREYGIGASALLIGRSPHCDIRISTHFVSREHARIVRVRDQVVIEDLGSKNGVFVNAVRVERGPLRHGDLVTIGETQFRFDETAASA